MKIDVHEKPPHFTCSNHNWQQASNSVFCKGLYCFPVKNVKLQFSAGSFTVDIRLLSLVITSNRHLLRSVLSYQVIMLYRVASIDELCIVYCVLSWPGSVVINSN